MEKSLFQDVDSTNKSEKTSFKKTSFKKTFFCQDKAKGLVPEKIDLLFDKDIDFPYYGLPFAEKITHVSPEKDSDPFYEYKSFFMEDRRKVKFEDTLAFKILNDPDIITPSSSGEYEEDGEKIIREEFKLIYYNPNSSMMKPTCLNSFYFQKEKGKKTKYCCEFIFVFNNEWIFLYEGRFELSNEEQKELDALTDTIANTLTPIDYIQSIINDIQDFKQGENFVFKNSPACTISVGEDGEETIELEVFNLKGEYRTIVLTKEDFDIIPGNLCSIRFIDEGE